MKELDCQLSPGMDGQSTRFHLDIKKKISICKKKIEICILNLKLIHLTTFPEPHMPPMMSVLPGEKNERRKFRNAVFSPAQPSKLRT